MNRRFGLFVGVAASLLFLYLAIRNTRWSEVRELFYHADYLYFVPGLLLLVAINWARAYRWRLLLISQGHIPLVRVFRIVNIGYLVNNLFPAKAGEVVRGVLLSRILPGGLAWSFSTLLVERLLDVLSISVLVAFLLPFVALPAWAIKGGLLFCAGAIGATLVLVVLSRFGTRGVDWVWRWVGRLPLLGHARVKAAAQGLVDGLRVLLVARLLPGVILGSAFVWLGSALFYYTLMAAFGMTLPFHAAVLALCATGFGMALPSSPGAMGVFEWATVHALVTYSVPQSQALGYALGMHVFGNTVSVILGALGLVREGLTWRDLRQEAMKDAPSPVA